jgi:hypothetical protein
MSNRFVFCICAIFVTILGSGQVLNVQGVQVGEAGQVSFTALVEKDHSERERYTLQIYSSADNYQSPLEYKITDMEPGRAYQAHFNGPEQVGDYSGTMQFRFRIEATNFPLKVDLQGKNKLKPGKKVMVSWSDYHNLGRYDIDLYRGNELVKRLANDHMNQSFSGTLSKDIEKGDDYALRIVPTDNPAAASDYIPIVVAGGVGWYWFAIPAVGGGVAAVVLTKGGGTGDNGFAEPPGTPDGN